MQACTCCKHFEKQQIRLFTKHLPKDFLNVVTGQARHCIDLVSNSYELIFVNYVSLYRSPYIYAFTINL